MRKQKKKESVQVAVGDLVLSIDSNGAVRHGGAVELTARDLDRVAAASALSVAAEKVWQGTLDNTRRKGWDVVNHGDGSASFGCQEISATDIAKVHKASLKQRGK